MAPRFIIRDAGGVVRTLRRIAIRDSGGTTRVLKRMFVRDGGGVARLVYESIRVATQPANVSGSSGAGSPSGKVISAQAACAFAGSNGTLTYAWHTTNCTADSPNSPNTTFSATVNAASTVDGTAYCTGSDGVNSVNTNLIQVPLTNTTPAVQIISGTINSNGIYPAAASAAVWFNSNGDQFEQTNQYPNGNVIGSWNPGGAPGSFDFRATLQSGTAPNLANMTDTLGTWVEATNSTFGASWGLTVTNKNGATETCTLLIEVAQHGTGVPLASGTVTLTVSDAA